MLLLLHSPVKKPQGKRPVNRHTPAHQTVEGSKPTPKAMASMVKARARRDRAKAVGQLGAEHTVHIAGAVRQAQLIARDRLGLDQAQRQAQLQSRLHHLPRLAGTGRIALRIGHHAGRVKNRDGHVCAPNGLKSP